MLLLTAALFGLAAAHGGDDANLFPRVPVKIVRGLPSAAPIPSPIARPVAFREPSPFSGPDIYRSLLDVSVAADLNGYTYTLNPFRNITQRSKSAYGAQSGFWGILGLFDGWENKDSDSHTMAGKPQQRYTDGCSCPGGKRRRTVVTLSCNEEGKYELKNVKEPRTCEYEAILTCPEACPGYRPPRASPEAVASPSSQSLLPAASPQSPALLSESTVESPSGVDIPLAALESRDTRALCASLSTKSEDRGRDRPRSPVERALDLLCAEVAQVSPSPSPSSPSSPGGPDVSSPSATDAASSNSDEAQGTPDNTRPQR